MKEFSDAISCQKQTVVSGESNKVNLDATTDLTPLAFLGEPAKSPVSVILERIYKP